MNAEEAGLQLWSAIENSNIFENPKTLNLLRNFRENI